MKQEELIPLEINETPEAIRQTIQHTRQQAKDAAKAIRQRQPRRIFLIGNGTSLYSSMAAAYTGRSLAASASDPQVMAVPAGDFRNFIPKLDERDILVGVSASGEFAMCW
jgi:fructoselysine-6-P-deglycase FrlB-like protein